MATKQVSVRLSATGGKQVRAELEGVGAAGARGFGRLTREMDAASQRMARFWLRANLGLAALAVTVKTTGSLMISSSLQTVDAQAKLAQSLGTTVASIQTLERAGELAGVSMSGIEQATKDLTRRLSQAASGIGPATDALDRLGLSAEGLLGMPLDARVDAINSAITDFIPVAERAAVAGQLFGEEGSIAMARIDSATLRQATQDLRDFGVVVSEQDADQIERTNDAISRLGLLWRGVANQLAVAAAPALEGTVNLLVDFAKVTGPLGKRLRLLFDNLARFGTYAATFVGFMAGRWVGGMVAAALSVRGLATALVFLKGALIRTGIGALIVGAGELVYWFTRLVQGAGGFGAAMGLLKDVASEVWRKVSLSAQAAWARVESSWAAAQATILDGFQTATNAVTNWANATLNTFEGTFLAVREIWQTLPEVFDRIGVLAINGLVTTMETGLAGITEAVNAVLTLGGRRPDWAIPAPDLSEWKSTVPEAVQLGRRAAEAYGRAFEDNPFQAPELFGGMADDARGRSSGYTEAARILSDAAARPLTAWQALRAVMAGSSEDGTAALDDASNSADRLASALADTENGFSGADIAAAAAQAGSASQVAAGQIRDAGEIAASGWAAVSDTLAAYARDAMDWGKGLGDTLVGAFRSAEGAFREFVTTGKVDFKGLVASILEDLAVLHFRNAVLGPIANALSSAFGGIGGGNVTAAVSHAGGMVGLSGHSRSIPALAFAGAPRMHSGGWAGLRPDEVPTILQRGERVLSRREVASAGQSAGPQRLDISVNVAGARGNREIEEMVNAGVSGALQQYDRLVAPRTLARVSQDPRRRG